MNQFILRRIILACFLLACLLIATLISLSIQKSRNAILLSQYEGYKQVKIDSKALNQPLPKTIHKGEMVHESEKEFHHTIRSGESMESIFKKYNLSKDQARESYSLLSKHIKHFKIYAGRSITLKVKKTFTWSKAFGFYHSSSFVGPTQYVSSTKNTLSSLSLRSDFVDYKITRDNQGLSLKQKKVELKKEEKHIFTTIEASLYVDLQKRGLHPNSIENLINLLSFDVDFQRDIRKGDSVEVLIERTIESGTDRILGGKVKYVNLKLKVNRRPIEYFIFGKAYYDRKGMAATKSFLKTPVPGARLTSRFGYRKHPILGYSRLHKGIDFAAPRGTPVYVAGDGVITFIGWNGSRKRGYGRYIKVRHSSTYSTAYAHLSKFNSRLKRGISVKQGQIIGYVGSTGYSTGPHLHYEVRKHGKTINPKKITSFSTDKVPRSKMTKFRAIINQTDSRVSRHRNAKHAADKVHTANSSTQDPGNAIGPVQK